jgi:hypothetical protein
VTQQLALPLQEHEKISPAQLRALHSLFHQLAPRSGFIATESAAQRSRYSFVLSGSANESGGPCSGKPPLILGDDRASSLMEGDDSVKPPKSSPIFSSERDQRLAWASSVIGRDVASFTALTSSEAATLIDALKRELGQPVRPPRSRRRPNRDQAHAYGTAGRRNSSTNEIRLVDAATLELIADLVDQLGWTQERLDAFLHSRMSPVRSGSIRTLPEANRVIWALKNMMRRAHFPRQRGKTTTNNEVRVAEESNTNEENQTSAQPECSSACVRRE